MDRRFVILFVCTICVLAGSVGRAQMAVSQDASQKQQSALVSVPIKIAAGDLLEISVFDAPELQQQVRVGADGDVQLALIGSTRVAGLTVQQASNVIAKELQERKFILHPQVNVMLRESLNQGVSVLGEVHRPGVYQVPGARSLLDVISMAGGLDTLADPRVMIKRRSGQGQTVAVRLNSNDAQASLGNDVQVYPGDVIVVPRAGIVYVLGDVNKPGGFVMQDNGGISALQALAQAGGANHTAALKKAIVMRKSANGYQTQPFNLGKAERGQEQDVQLSANDILFVPNSKIKSALHDTQSVATSIGSASIYAIVH